MFFSKPAEYAIRAMTFLAMLPPGRLAGAREISQAEQIPMPFLWKVLHTLTRRKLIRSFKGMHGGYELARPSEQITIGMLLDATDSRERMQACVLGLPHCSDTRPCPMHETWKELRTRVSDMIEENTLADLVRISRARGIATAVTATHHNAGASNG